MRLIDADELIKDRVENDPVRIAVKCAPTAFDKEKVIEKIKCERDEAQDYNQYSAVAAHEIDIDIVGKGGTE